jgi:hypothetical protein
MVVTSTYTTIILVNYFTIVFFALSLTIFFFLKWRKSGCLRVLIKVNHFTESLPFALVAAHTCKGQGCKFSKLMYVSEVFSTYVFCGFGASW